MKIRSREINVVSMSALDLFCCALGAFIALALLALPYFPNVSPKKPEAAAAAKPSPAEKGLKAQAVDVVIVIDTTGSMADPIKGLQNEIQDFVGVMGSLSDHARVGIIEYKDRCEPQPVRFSEMQPAGKDGNPVLTAFAQGLNAFSSTCNPDLPEDIYDAVDKATRTQWQAPEKSRYVIVIGDQPPYPEQMQALPELAARFAKTGGHLSTMYATAKPDPAIEAYYKQLAQAGNGVATANGGSFGMAMLKAIAN